MTQPYHPTCGKRFPGGAQAGHCAVCCETFIGNTAFEAHRVGDWDNRRCEIQPYETTSDDDKTRYGHWQDDKGHWHHGKRLSKDERAAIWGDKEEA